MKPVPIPQLEPSADLKKAKMDAETGQNHFAAKTTTVLGWQLLLHHPLPLSPVYHARIFEAALYHDAQESRTIEGRSAPNWFSLASRVFV